MMDWSATNSWIVAAAVLSAVSCALLGNFMLLRRLSMMGDAISHAVLPGLVIAFLVTDSRGSLAMFIGAVVVGVLTAVFVQSIHHYGDVEQSAAMGVVFTTLFAIGIIMVVRAANHVDLDVDCVLYGAIEAVPLMTGSPPFPDIPSPVFNLAVMLVINILFVVIFFKELRISAFDPALATTLGINAQLMHYLLMTLVAMTTVAAFESVGSILVIAMLIVPPATAHLLTDRLWSMVLASVGVAIITAVGGHVSAIVVPQWFGYQDTSTAGMMATVAGFLLMLAVFFSPHHGVLSKWYHRMRLTLRITCEDILGLLYRLDESNVSDADVRIQRIGELLAATGSSGKWSYKLALLGLEHQGKLTTKDNTVQLTDRGAQEAQSLIRAHRLWELYIYRFMNQPVDKLHSSAEQLEHVTDSTMRAKLAATMGSPDIDPHGRNIPEH